MPRRRIDKRNIRNIQRSHGTYYISIPIEMIRELGWQERQKVVVRRFGKGLRIKDWPIHRSGSGGGKSKD